MFVQIKSMRMKRMHLNRKSARLSMIAAAVLLLSGCVTVPDAIKGTSPTPQDDLVRVMNAPQIYVGQESRFGGRVVSIRNEANKTRLEIASMPLDSGAKPLLDMPSEGRFIAYVNRFLEPVDFKDQLVTVVGLIVGTEQGAIGDKPYRYVVIDAQGYKRWNVVQRLMVPPGGYGPWGWRAGYGYGWGPGWGFDGGWPGPARIENIVTE
ncbi:Slp family lipoprotein [Pectobacterium parmentieri]|uniref:Outer membrane lipoprotein, Slp family n=1 Tax=Pectobacterium parmentieri TaxID=1905730 RepID=A0A0H3I3S4_PECPM|nr:Slp family lipoprotein [Pectobacterium parmentieri]AFI90260.1 Outer membrane lipoprotein, Slp family [Pectobacterium parmentieri]MBI0471546.1 Slp family lipoprotein [Pectobacterium parmentieri]MBI0494231.1 Slp family lipoprotein [Pectobacterium parmentieri]MBI0555453.1 Slp family lipoprotein [Pectobacterium parmentieri]MBI0568560.1 Slp family lipoprotein [Pectobacterium parmentieri]